MTASLAELVTAVVNSANMPDSPDHGEQHWRAVAATGQQLCTAVPDADPVVVFLFALFHDTRRESEWDDPQHGLRAAVYVQDLYAYGTLSQRLTAAQVATLVMACTDHDRGRVSDDPTIGVCWDADRLQLWRVGIEPDPALLSTDAARALLPDSRDLWRGSYDWDLLSRGLR